MQQEMKLRAIGSMVKLIGKGCYSDPYGDIFEGEWKENNPSAYGIYKYSNGDEYKGYVQHGTRKGHGVYTELHGNKLYANWDNDFISENLISSRYRLARIF